jgi:hypothetical protein
MGLVTFASVKASPGVTTTAALVAARWPEQRMLIEADESGGVLAADLGLGETPSALELAGTARTLDEASIDRHCQVAFAGLPVLVAPGEPHRVAASYRELAQPLAAQLADAPVTGIVDAGRLTPGSPVWPLVTRSSLVVMVARCRLAEFVPLSGRCGELRAAGARLALVLVAEGPYDPDEFASAAGLELLAALPIDSAATVVRGVEISERALARSGLWAAVGELASVVHARVAASSRNGSRVSAGA